MAKIKRIELSETLTYEKNTLLHHKKEALNTVYFLVFSAFLSIILYYFFVYFSQ